MTEHLLAAVRDQIEQSDPPVKAAALLHFARVLTAFDRAEAERVLERGIALVSEIPEPDVRPLIRQAAYLAAAVSPPRAFDLMTLVKDPFHGTADGIIFNMLNHGHLAEAVSWLSKPPAEVPYPFHAALKAIGFSRDDHEARRNILRGAIQAWRAGSKSGHVGEFEEIFVHCWKVLSEPEATEVVREIVARIEADSDRLTGATFSSGAKVARLSSIRESRLFTVYVVVYQLDPELANSLCRKHSQLAKAISVFPRGYGEEPEVPAEENPEENSPKRCEQPDSMMVHGRRDLLPMSEALRTDFREPFAAALRLYVRDTDPENPNNAPKECWPSAMEFRKILHKAGRHQGLDAARLLNRIRDRDLFLFAEIELLAAIMDLPQLGGMSVPPRRRQMAGRPMLIQ